MSNTLKEETKHQLLVPFREALFYWFKLGFISFGGPAGQISMMHQEVVERRRWISEHRFMHALNFTMVLPGPEAQQLATYIGWLMHGIKGGIAAGVLFVLPSLIILAGLTWAYLVFSDVRAVTGVLFGIKPAVTAIVAFAAYRIGRRALKNNVLMIIAAIAFTAIFVFNTPFPYIVIAAGLVGLLGSRIAPQKFQTGNNREGQEKTDGAAVIDDDTPVPVHARFNLRHSVVITAISLFLWGGALAWIAAAYGWEGTLTQMGWFFTKAALVTFGGAYAVLPYVYQGGVEYYAWLTTSQMIDGLALGETTPGPLIMIVAFVGFVGGWTKEIFGPGLLHLAGIAGACTATLFTFFPSFLFIFLGGPLVEATRHEIRFTAPLTGITAAVVGVILNLAVFFAYHVLWPSGFKGGFEWFSFFLGLASFIALARYKAGIATVIIACAALGMIYIFYL